MKRNHTKLLVSTLLLGSLFSCNNSLASSLISSNSSDSSQDSSLSTEDTPKISEVNAAIKNVQQGFNLSATITSVKREEQEKEEFEYTYLNNQEEGYHRKLSHTSEDNISQTTLDETIFKDSDGSAYKEKLGLDNVVGKIKISESESYDALYVNPLGLLNEDDFTLVDGGKYNLDLHKMTIVSNFLNPTASTKLTAASVTIANNKFTSFDFTYSSYVAEEESGASTSTTFQGTFSYENVKLTHLVPFVETDDQKKLSAAIESLGNTFVIDYVNNKNSKHHKVYYTGKSVFFQDDYQAKKISEYYDYWWNTIQGKEDNKLHKLTYYSYGGGSWDDAYETYDSYDVALPKFNSVASALYTYDKSAQTYTLPSTYAEEAAKFFVPKMYTTDVSNSEGLTITIGISESKLNNIKLKSDAVDIEMSFSAFDKLPFDIKDEPVTLAW